MMMMIMMIILIKMMFFFSFIVGIKTALEDLKNEYNLECVYSAGLFLDYMPINVNKGTSLIQLIKLLNISREQVIAFGDNDNDIQMLQTAGWPVVMANANNEIKSYAKLIAKSNAEDGVADMLERIFLKKE